MRPIHHKYRAFTLVELLVSIGIIALLIALLLPSLAAAKSQANAVVCMSNVRQIASAALMYAQDHGAYVGWAPGIDRKMLLYPYLQQGKSNMDIEGNQVWNCPENQQQEIECSYGFNTNLNWVNLSEIRNWSATVALCDSGIRDNGMPTLSTMCHPPSTMSVGTNYAYRPNPRHRGRLVTVGFVDGHAERLEMKEPFYPGEVGVWMGNGITDPQDPQYKNHLWDLK